MTYSRMISNHPIQAGMTVSPESRTSSIPRSRVVLFAATLAVFGIGKISPTCAGGEYPISNFTVVSATESQSAEFQTPPLSPGTTLALEFFARGETTGPDAPPAYLLNIRINGREVVAASDRLNSQLRNKPPTENGLAWHRSLVGWLIPLARDFPDQPQERFRTLVEVGSLLRNDTNRIEFSLVPQADPKQKIHLKEIRLIDLPTRPLSENFVVVDEQSLALRTSPAGDLAIQMDGLDRAITSSLGHPGGTWIQRGPPVQDWKTIVSPATIGETPDVLQTDSIRWKREVRQVAPDHFSIEETITNPADSETGTMFRIDLPFPLPVPNVYLGGDSDPSLLQKHEAANPTLFIPIAGCGIGIVAEDDLFRSQMIAACRSDGGAVSLRAERLYLPPHGTLSLKWSLYLLKKNDYFDFINRVRSDWGVRMRIPGPFWWDAFARADKSDLELQSFLARQRPYAAVIGSWVDQEKHEAPQTVGLGVGVMEPEFEQYRTRLKRFTGRIKRLDPKLKVLLYNHFFYNWPEPDSGRFIDSWITTESGNRFGVPASRGDSPAVGLFPTATNGFGQAFRESLVRQRREIGVDGFYFDESTAPGRLSDPISYGSADGGTALLDPSTFSVKQQVGHLSLLTAPYLEELTSQLLDAQLIAIGNFAPVTAHQNRQTWPRFVETDNLTHCASAHLYSPLAFSYRFENYTIEDVRQRLEQGLVWCVTGPEDRIGIIRHFFPLTPLRIHAGWIEAEERIITTRSGSYGWDASTPNAILRLYDSKGHPTISDPDGKEIEWNRAERSFFVEVPPGGIAILERKIDN